MTGGKQSQLLVLSLSLEFDKTLKLKLDEAVCEAEEANLNKSKLENQLRIIKTEVPGDKIDYLKGEIKSVTSKES